MFPIAFARIELLLLAFVELYCAIGFLKQKALARKVFIWYSLYGIAGFLFSIPELISIMRSIDESYRMVSLFPLTFGLAFGALVLLYVIWHKDYFPN